jgi:homogentisate 1,2-dioxygenase
MVYQRGYVPKPLEGSELYEQSYTRKGFFGPYARLYKTRNLGAPIRADKELGPYHLDLKLMQPSDLTRADGFPAPVLLSASCGLYVSRRAQAMPFAWRNADGDELQFVHRGACRVETEFGHLGARAGDFVYLPRNVVYRVMPESDDLLTMILETRGLLEPADQYHRQHGMTSSGLDMSRIELPEVPAARTATQGEYEVKTKIEGKVYSAVYDHDPLAVTVGWVGDPIVFKLSAWDVPAARSPFSPPTSTAFMTPDEQDCIVAVRRPTGRPGGPPGHTNDWDELWFLHSASAPNYADNVGVLRWDPQGATQPGARYTFPRHDADPDHLNLDIDVKDRLRLTDEAAVAVLDGMRALDP